MGLARWLAGLLPQPSLLHVSRQAYPADRDPTATEPVSQPLMAPVKAPPLCLSLPQIPSPQHIGSPACPQGWELGALANGVHKISASALRLLRAFALGCGYLLGEPWDPVHTPGVLVLSAPRIWSKTPWCFSDTPGGVLALYLLGLITSVGSGGW